MVHTISNGILTAVFSEIGGELISLKRNGIEYLHDGNPKYWNSIAPLMFPVCGRLWDGKYTYRGKEYEMKIHGFIRHAEMKVTEHDDTSITFCYESSDETRVQYPFDFLFKVAYTLKGSTLVTAFTVENKTDGELLFSLGGHPGFRLPLEGKGDFSDCYIEFDSPCAAKSINFSATCYRVGNDGLYAGDALKTIDLRHELFDDDAIFLYDTAKTVTLRSKASSSSVRMDFDGFRYLGLWHAPRSDANYVCIEPWTGSPAYEGRVDALETKEDMTRLEKGGVYEAAFSITIE